MKARRLARLVNLYRVLEAKDLQKLESLKRQQREALERRTHALERLSSIDPISLASCGLYQSCATVSAKNEVHLKTEIEAAAQQVAQRRSQLNRFDRRRRELQNMKKRET